MSWRGDIGYRQDASLSDRDNLFRLPNPSRPRKQDSVTVRLSMDFSLSGHSRPAGLYAERNRYLQLILVLLVAFNPTRPLQPVSQNSVQWDYGAKLVSERPSEYAGHLLLCTDGRTCLNCIWDSLLESGQRMFSSTQRRDIGRTAESNGKWYFSGEGNKEYTWRGCTEIHRASFRLRVILTAPTVAALSVWVIFLLVSPTSIQWKETLFPCCCCQIAALLLTYLILHFSINKFFKYTSNSFHLLCKLNRH